MISDRHSTTGPAKLSRADLSERLVQLGMSLAAQPHMRRGVPLADEPVRVILVDDHAMVREGLRIILRAAPDITVVGEAENGEAALALAERVSPNMVILDLDMPRGDGEGALRRLKHALPNVRVLILTMFAEDDRLLPLLEGGADGYLTKEAASSDLVEAIRVVASGGIYVRPAAARLLAAAFVPQRAAQTARGQFLTLSDREQSVLRMVAHGYSGVEIARELGISTKTVDAYKRRVEEKLGLEHRTHYVRFAIEAGILGR
ncbi:MAG: response regulator [Gemmatimonadaceae bacterium]